MKKILSLIVSLMLMLGMVTAAQAEVLTDGIYSKTQKGFGGDICVTVTVADGKITNVSAEGEKETDGIGTKAIELLPAQIVAAQGTQIDAIGGATVSSTAVLSAAQAAINEAAGAAVAEVKMAPGTYTATEYGFQQIAPITVTLTVDEKNILDIQIDGNKDSVAMVRSVNTYLLPRILEYQSYEVDAITGATATSNAVLSGTRAALLEALAAGGADASAIAAFETTETRVAAQETIETDVLVVGLGAAGTAAALAAAESQTEAGMPVSVLGIDKAGRWGGTGAFTGSIMAVNAKGIKDTYHNGEDYMDGEDLYQTWLEYTEGDAKEEIVRTFLDNSGDTIDWLYFKHGMQLNEPIAYFGSKWACVYDYVSRNTFKADHEYLNDYSGTEAVDGQNTMVDKYYARLYQDFEAIGGKVMLETNAYSLLYDEASNNVTGVLATGHDGTEYTINAKKVILATGGYGGSAEKNVEYLSENPYYEHLGDSDWQMIGMLQNKGDMLDAAMKIGAGSYNLAVPPMVHFAGSNIVLHDYPVEVKDQGTINLWYGWDFTWSKNDVPTALALTSYCPWVDVDGDRFGMEGALFGWWKAGPCWYAIYDQSMIDNIAADGFPASISTYANGTQGGIPAGIPIPEMNDILDKLVASGQIWKADSLEELSGMIGVNAETFAAEMAKYNEYCANGIDEQFGKDAEKLIALNAEGPYYAVKGYSHSFCSCGGLNIDANMQVLKADGQTSIGGLYATGLDSCGVLFTEKKPYVTYGGAALGWAYTSGRLAGINAVADMQ
ncbi:MAG: FAD-binding protein [Eubacteriales bacterium]|nr:FAD-binding protein [Eubacteriales bacterium]